MFFKKFYIIYISLLLILIKWFFSFYFFQEEIDVRVLFESVADGKYYFPLIKFLSDLNFNFLLLQISGKLNDSLQGHARIY